MKQKKRVHRQPPRSKGPAALKCHRFVGISLGGGKSDRTAITVLEYYVDQKKIIVSRMVDRLKSEGELSSDLKLHEYVQQFKSDVDLIALDVPLSLPKCFRCQLPCPGYEVCDEEEILWMWKQFRAAQDEKKNARLFTPYTRRCAEVFWSDELSGAWAIGDALGANQAPLLARGRFISRRWDHSLIEVIPRLSLLRWANKAKISKVQVRNHRHSVNGHEAREYILRQLSDQLDLFIYDQDKSLMADHLVAFDSLWVALTAYWKFRNQCVPRPRSFPKEEGWIEVPEF
jgi:hypothetical protein